MPPHLERASGVDARPRCGHHGPFVRDSRRAHRRLRAAHGRSLDAASARDIDAAVGIADTGADDDASHLLRYDDPRRGHSRRVLVRAGVLAAVSLRGDWSAEGWRE